MLILAWAVRMVYVIGKGVVAVWISLAWAGRAAVLILAWAVRLC